jgi:hypothetical protein
VHALDTLAFQALFDQPLTNGAEDVGTEYTGESIRHLSMLITDKLIKLRRSEQGSRPER